MDGITTSTAVTIGMPVYNGERYLEETLKSVLRQTFVDFTLIITDNASTDRTEQICREAAAKDPRIVYLRNSTNVGAAANYELCFKPATSRYFRWQNADDPIEPTLIANCVEILERHPDVVLAYGKTNLIDSEGKLIREYEDRLHLMQDDPADRFISGLKLIDLQNHMYGVIRREALARTARMKPFRSADINLICELSLYGKFFQIQRHLFNRRLHPESSSWNMKDDERLRNFWDPAKRKLVMQTWRGMWEYVRAACRAPIKPSDKLKIIRYLLKHAYWRKSVMMAELSAFIRYGLLKSL